MKKTRVSWTLTVVCVGVRTRQKNQKKTFISFCGLGLAIFFFVLLGSPNHSIAERIPYGAYCFALPDPHWIHRTGVSGKLFSNLVLKAKKNAEPRAGYIGLLQTSKISAYAETEAITPSRELLVYYWAGYRWELSIDPDLYGASFSTNIESLYENLSESIDGAPVVHIPMDSDPSKLYPNGCSDFPKLTPANTPNPAPGDPTCNQVPLN